ncbi:hypothetical protein SAY87_000022 [Trapa incisa]|uniref:C2H2-type domain-containing protein n=1 Tax=Trapa incisa TaxID=236973 RepID=A0AAN7GEQ1_9MYRT|nr:hypothetical protein SAY87_000022 [Trapa incisa]
MAAELRLLSLTHLQQLLLSAAQSQTSTNPSSEASGGASSWMWNPDHQVPPNPRLPGQSHQDDDSWEVRAFEEDTSNIMGTTWPPRSYACIFCRREFRSAQALGGHMNVHRRDRAKLHQTTSQYSSPIAGGGLCSSFSTTRNTTMPSHPLIIPNQHLVTGQGGPCLDLYHYQLPNPNGTFSFSSGLIIRNDIWGPADSSNTPSTLPSAAACPPNRSNDEFLHGKGKASSPTTTHMKNTSNICKDQPSVELDLELRLGQRPTGRGEACDHLVDMTLYNR